MSAFTTEHLNSFLSRKSTLILETEMILQNSIDLQKLVTTDVFDGLHHTLAVAVHENANRWKALRWDLIVTYGSSYFIMPDTSAQVTHDFGVTSDIWNSWEQSSNVMNSTINGLEKIKVIIQVLEAI